MLVNHPFAPIYNANAKVLILGTIPSPKSRETGFYYGHPQNRFWTVIANVFNDKTPESIEEKVKFLHRNKIALWDVLRSCEINGASDASIRSPVANDFSLIFDVAEIKTVFATGKTAQRLYTKLTGHKAEYLPSPSAANCQVSIYALQEAYKAVRRAVDS